MVEQLSAETLELLRGEGYKETSLYCVKKIQKQVIRAHKEKGEELFKPEIFAIYLENLNAKFKDGGYTQKRYNFLLRSASFLKQYWETGEIETAPRKVYPDVPECFRVQFFDEYVAAVAPHHHKMYPWRVRPYLLWLEKNGCTDISKVDENMLRTYMLEYSKRVCLNSLDNERMNLKHLHRYLFAKGLISKDFSLLFANPVAFESKIKKPIPPEEIAATFRSIDRTTDEGKRRYAMFMLSAITGLRGIDIVKLKRQDIDWQKGEIRITQSKTGKALALPLTEDVGEAVKDYLLNARPNYKFDTVFLTRRAPFKPMGYGRAVGEAHDRQGCNYFL